MKARKIQDSAISKAPPHVREIWDWILKECNHKGTNVCKRGQCIRSYRDIIEGLSWYVGWRKMTYSKHHCEIAMKWLKKATMITTKKTTKGILISVVKYDYYQNPSNYESYKRNHTKATRKPQTTDTINKNERMKECKNNTGEHSPQKKETQFSPLGAEIIKLMETVNPACKKFYNNITQRKACEELLKDYSFEDIEKLIALLPKTNTMQFFPIVTTPAQLRDKWAALEAAMRKKKNELQDKPKVFWS